MIALIVGRTICEARLAAPPLATVCLI